MDQISMNDRQTARIDQGSLLERAVRVSDLIATEAPISEKLGRLTDRTIAALKDEGLFRLMIPACYGGLEAGAVEALEVLEKICEADGSTGWVLMACSVVTGTTAAFLPEAAAQVVFGNGCPLIAGQGAPRGRAVVEGDGYRLSGKWSYGSGTLHSDYLHTGAMAYENGEARGPLTCIVPVDKVQFLENWDVVGLRATGSVDYAIDNVYVPREFTHSPDTLVPLRGSDIFRMGIVGLSPLAHGSFALGVGRRMLDELAALATSSGGKPAPLADAATSDSFQEGYGTAEAKLRGGRSFLYDVYRDAEATIRRGDPISMRQISLMRLALNHATVAAADVCTFAYHAGGGVALRSGILQRCFRDMMAATQHRIVSGYMLRQCSREMLGLAEGKLWTSYGLIDPPRERPN